MPKQQHLDEINARIERQQIALTEIMYFNRLRNDKDAYLLAMAQWGLTGKWGVDNEFTKQPQRNEFGLEE